MFVAEMKLQNAKIVYNANNDQFWGCCNGGGENVLGTLLMKIRENLAQRVQTTEYVQWKKITLIKYSAECNWYISLFLVFLLTINKVCRKGSAEIFDLSKSWQRISSAYEQLHGFSFGR